MALYNDGWRKRLGIWMPLMGVVAGGAGVVAGFFGEHLLESNPSYTQVIGDHGELGEVAAFLGACLSVATIVVWALTDERPRGWLVARLKWLEQAWVMVIIKLLGTLSAILALVFVAIAGHSGARAVWGR